MKKYSISIEHKDEAIPLLEKLGYKEDKDWNEGKTLLDKTHILADAAGTWGVYNHDGVDNTPITIEELRELAGESTPDKLEILIEQMRELRAELREFMKEEKPSEAQKWKVGNRVRITKKGTHCFINRQVVELIEHRKDNANDNIPWFAESQSGRQFWLSESEAGLITE